ncbi:hypothetical protein [Bradyrhizobium sp.]|uniref:hypothetical protein n=1 Tax=Bradyrhizobium sp. TaxID=376 RepID=UPI0025BD6205|nr:hypothetical protein [Bradyrhizobium sp.]
MDIAPYRFDLSRLAAIKRLKPGLIGPVVLLGCLGVWLWSGYPGNPAQSQPVRLSTATTEPPALNPATPATDAAREGPLFGDPAIAPDGTAAIDGLKISSQSWRRGGLGSNALVTFTLRNGNDYAVRDIEISCVFTRRDGSHLTDRTRMIHDIVNMKSRRTFARMHVGYVNVNANQAKCALVAATRI